MNREVVLKKFENEIEEITKEHKKELIKFRVKNNEKLMFDIKKTVDEIVDKFNGFNESEVYFINFSLLRTSLLENNFQYLLSFHGEQIFYEIPLYSEKISFLYLFDQITILKTNFEKESKKFQNIVKKGDIDRFIQKKIFLFHEFIYNLLGEVLKNFYSWENYKLLKKNDKVKILIGEYHEMPLELIVGGE